MLVAASFLGPNPASPTSCAVWKGAAGFVTAFEARLDALEPYALQKVLASWMAFWHLQVLLGGGYAVFSGAGTFLTWRCGPCKKESQPVCTCSRKLSTTYIYIFIFFIYIPVVPHKAVAEVSKIGNL